MHKISDFTEFKWSFLNFAPSSDSPLFSSKNWNNEDIEPKLRQSSSSVTAKKTVLDWKILRKSVRKEDSLYRETFLEKFQRQYSLTSRSIGSYNEVFMSRRRKYFVEVL
jgi:hypothetical protein